MTLAYDYPMLGLFWTIFFFFAWVGWLVAVFYVFRNIFRSDMRGVAKAAWSIFVLLMPFVGVIVYLVARGDDMAREQGVTNAAARDAAFHEYARQAAGTSAMGDQLAQLVSLHDAGHISDVEYEAGKAKVLA